MFDTVTRYKPIEGIGEIEQAIKKKCKTHGDWESFKVWGNVVVSHYNIDVLHYYCQLYLSYTDTCVQGQGNKYIRQA